MKIIVTGGAGMIGSNLCSDLLAAGWMADAKTKLDLVGVVTMMSMFVWLVLVIWLTT